MPWQNCCAYLCVLLITYRRQASLIFIFLLFKGSVLFRLIFVFLIVVSGLAKVLLFKRSVLFRLIFASLVVVSGLAKVLLFKS
jgi:hypothetical protein